MQTKKTHWASLLVLIVFGFSLLILGLIVILFGFTSFFDLFSGGADPATGMISAFAFGFVSVLLLLCSWFVLQKTRGLEQADHSFKFPFAGWLWIVIPVVVFFSILIGGAFTMAELPWLNWLVLPALTIMVIVPPIWLLFGTASNGIELGPRWRFFSILGLGMTISPMIMIVLEIVILVTVVILGVIYVAVTQPALINQLETLANMADQSMSEDAMLAAVTPYLSNPAVIAVGIGYIALLVPLIEELLKPLALWFFARQIETPAQGFALGVLSGAAFALFESLNASADGSTSWAFIVGARTGTSLLHMLTSGLVGWGIIAAIQEKRARRFFAAYIGAVLIHGIWNASAAGIGLAILGESIGKPEWFFNFAPALLCGLMTLGIGVAALLLQFNRRLRKPLTSPVAAEPLESNPKEIG
ncbi:MAG: PrsW family intramembrane metalloprotease [Anaerolineales bacterium]|nr:PrsW family intramembrane metalloprotease [Anaerolineales bacterium]